MKSLFRALLLIAGTLLIIISIYGFIYFVIDLRRMMDMAKVHQDLEFLSPANFPRKQLYIVGFVGSLEHLTLGLLSIFAATKITIAKDND